MQEPKSEVFNMDINKIYNEDCLGTLKRMPNDFIDLTVTSPPYDNLRKYNGYSFDFENIAKELYRVTKIGGVVVWIVGDATINGSETGTSFRQALFFKECGFNLHDTMIWRKPNAPPQTIEGRRYTLSHEYMFIFCKKNISTFNPLVIPCNNAGKKTSSGTNLRPNGTVRIDRIDARKGKIINETKKRYSVWDCGVNAQNIGHPAAFPEQLCADHIHSWSNEGDLVYDPFMGSGTTGKMANLMNRNYLGSEISKEYFDIANKRIALHKQQTKLF
jgi:site-specific DNA-methyltransferase (adenine-specific)